MSIQLASDVVLARVRSDAYARLLPRERQRSILAVDRRVHAKGDVLGPSFQQAVCDRPSIVVFVDDVPGANFAHPCRYFVYAADDGERYATFAAQFPPYVAGDQHSWQVFSDPSGVSTRRAYNYAADVPPPADAIEPLSRQAPGERYAILLAGMPEFSHLNDLEFCYRMLTRQFGFPTQNVAVLNNLGSRTSWQGCAPAAWPGDNTSFILPVRGPGTRKAFQQVLSDLKLGKDDLLFVMMTGHGGNHFLPHGESYLCEAAKGFGLEYKAQQLGADLACLPAYRALVVIMQQCHGAGMIDRIRSHATAGNMSIASACRSNQYSYVLHDDANWSSFSWHWLGAQFGTRPDGLKLEFDPDKNVNRMIEADEAFAFARDASTAHPQECPVHYVSAEGGGALTLR